MTSEYFTIFIPGDKGFSNCIVMLRPQQIIDYNVSRTTSLFWHWICCLAGGYTDGPCPLQDKSGAVVSSMVL
jgi:hypothetical protein